MWSMTPTDIQSEGNRCGSESDRGTGQRTGRLQQHAHCCSIDNRAGS